MAGAVGMIRNWSFTLFYCSGELWGDVVLSLLFWGLANELTDMEEAPMLYPLFGVGANVGQTISGKMLSMFSGTSASSISQSQRVQVRSPGLDILANHRDRMTCCIPAAHAFLKSAMHAVLLMLHELVQSTYYHCYIHTGFWI